MTFFSAFDVPVYWPILVMYFLTLAFISARERIRHMVRLRPARPSPRPRTARRQRVACSPRRMQIKHRYLPFDFGGKPTYTKKEPLNHPSEGREVKARKD